MSFKILDCTLRDGGYYTNWDFDKQLLIKYSRAMEELPIDYVEIGYRSITLEGYLGKCFYCPEYVMKELEAINFTNVSNNSPMVLAVQTALDLGVTSILMTGFDDYDDSLNQSQLMLA
ncbi:hypothetical protein [Flavivirga aquatica]|nr:hypothetical protein [Flavivirga aquatica]